jgi:HD-GYP domain-containing protein (c-di-GMP phosphodiesterase class II)
MEPPELFEKKFSILKDISNAMVITDNVNAIANLMLDLAINYTNADKGSLMLVNESNELYILAARGIDINLFRTYRMKMGEGIAGTVAKNRRPVLVEDIDTDKRFKNKKRDRYKTRSFISCPALSKNKLLGVLNINDKKDGTPFTEGEFALVQTIANQAAIVLENAFLMNQLKAKAAELEEINRRLIEVDIAKTEFITRASHELRTPLNSIKGSIYYLQQTDKHGTNNQREFYDIIANETSTLISTVEKLLDFLRLENELQLINKSMINLPDLLDEVANQKALQTTLARKNLTLDIDVKPGKSDIVGDKTRVMQFFVSLVEGISHYLGSGDVIRISLNEDDFVKVSLAVSRRLPEVQPFLFDSRNIFFADYSEEKLKLYLARKIAELHNWTITAENSGDSFLICITMPKNIHYKVEAFVNTTMDLFVAFISELLDLRICSVMLRDEVTSELTIKSARGLDAEVVTRTKLKLGDSIAGWVALEGKPLLIEDINRDSRFGKQSIPQYNTNSLLSVPLKIQDKVIGVLNLNNKKNAEPFRERDLQLASMVSERISYFIERLYSGEYQEDECKKFIASFEDLLNAEKKYHKKDPLFSTLMSNVMERLGANEEQKRLAIYVSTLYDLGLVLIDERILKKKKLLSSEINSIKVHPYTGVSLLEHFEFSADVKKAVLHHHEKYDGTGYPDKLKGDEIPFLSRVLAVVDAFCSLIEERPYRKALAANEALLEIKRCSGSAYDPRVVQALEESLSQLNKD